MEINDILHRCTQAKQRAKQIAKAWSTGTHRGRGLTSRLKLLARLRVMKSIIIPTLTTFSQTRPWSKAQINALQTVQSYALQRVFGLDRLAMQEHHITNQQLHNACLYGPLFSSPSCVRPCDGLATSVACPLIVSPKSPYSVPGPRITRPIQSITQIRWLHDTLRQQQTSTISTSFV